MALTFVSRSSQTQQEVKVKASTLTSKKTGHSKALPTTNIDIQQPGRLRAGHLMTLFSVSHSTLYNRIRVGKIPKPDGNDGNRPYWNTETIRQALQQKQA